MKYTSIFEKIECLANIITSSIIYPIFLLILLLLVILVLTKKIKGKKVTILITINYIILFLITIMSNQKSLGNLFESISTNLFTNIYFPSVYTYLFILIVMDIATITGILNIKTKKTYKKINSIFLFINKFMQVLILEVISKNKIDVFVKKSLFSNQNLVVLLEISVNIFIIWLLTLIVTYVSEKLTERIEIKQSNKTENKNQVLTPIENNTLVVENSPNMEEEYLSQNKDKNIQIPETDNFQIETPQTNQNISTSDMLKELEQIINEQKAEKELNNIKSTVQEIKQPEENSTGELLLSRLLNNELPLIKEDKITEKIQEDVKDFIIPSISQDNNPKEKQTVETINKPENNYTLNDYKIFNKILKDIKTFNNSNIITIDRSLDLILKAKYTKEEYSLFKCMLKNYSN